MKIRPKVLSITVSTQHKDLMEFENDLQKMISKVQFGRVNNDFQKRLKNDIRSI